MIFIDSLLSFILVALILVSFHELGHFLVGIFFKADIKEFSIGFGPEILSFPMKKYGRFSIRIFLFGGYVRFNEDRDHPSSRALFSLAPWKRMCIALAGPLFNVLLSFVLFSTIILWHGYSKIPNLDHAPISGVVKNSPADKAGLKAGDILLKANGVPLNDFRKFAYRIQQGKTHPIHFLIQRKKKKINITISPKPLIQPDIFGRKKTRYIIGIYPPKPVIVHPGLLESLGKGMVLLSNSVGLTVKSLGLLVTGQLDMSNVSGPVGIAKLSSEAIHTGFTTFLLFLAFFSINLAVFNLIPLPILDGGMFVLALIEWVRKKPLSSKIYLRLIFFSLVILLSLVIFFTIMDFNK